MLQQTQVSRVLEKYPAWIRLFPTLEAFARTSTREALLAWTGMGYNRRVLYLHSAARRIVGEHHARVPRDIARLRTLPGIGEYTAHAIMCFAFDERVPVVDVNIRRVLSRISVALRNGRDALDEHAIWKLAEFMLPPRAYFSWNQALMDLGATVCTRNTPACMRCPLRTHCSSAASILRPKPLKRTSRKGIEASITPRRIFRGRVIELLRQRTGTHSMSFSGLGTCLRESFSSADHEWLADILVSLEDDGMIVALVHGRRVSFSEVKEKQYQRVRVALP